MAVELTRGGYSPPPGAGRLVSRGDRQCGVGCLDLPLDQAGYAAAANLVSGLHNLAGWLDPLRLLSPFWVAGSAPLQNGVRRWGVLVCGRRRLVTLAAGSVLVDRRDIESP